MTLFERATTNFEGFSLDPLSNVLRLTDLVRRGTGTEYCRLDILARDQRTCSSFTKTEVKTLELTRESFVSMRKPLQLHCLNNNVLIHRPADETFVYQEFRRFPRCASLFAVAVPEKSHGTWGLLIMEHPTAYHFTEERVKFIIKILDAFLNNTKLSYLTNLVHLVQDLQRSDKAASFVNIVRRFLKGNGFVQSLGMAVLNARRDRAAMFVEDDVKQFDVDPRTVLFRSMADEVDRPNEIHIPSMMRATREAIPSDVKILLPVNPMLPGRYCVFPLRKPKTKMPTMLTLDQVVDDGNPGDRCLGMLYFEVHKGAMTAFSQCMTSLEPVIANLLSHRLDIAKEVEHILRIVDRRATDVGCPAERRKFLEKYTLIMKEVRQTKRQEWGQTKPPLEGLSLMSIVSQRWSGAIVKGSKGGQDVAVKLKCINRHRCCPDRRELEISRSLHHDNIVATLDHKIDVSGKQILRCSPCRCPSPSCPHHEIEKVLSSIVSPIDVCSSRWDILITEWCEETLSSLIHVRKLYALPFDRPWNGDRCLDWRIDRCWNAELTLTMMLSLAGVLNYLHSIGIVFGDFNPENVLIKVRSASKDVEKWRAKLGDFGNSCVEGFDRIRSNCTLAYSPPEFMSLDLGGGRHPDGYAGDVYSFALVLWEMVSCKKPFSRFIGNSIGLQQWVERNGRCDFRDGFPTELRNLIERCWHQIPEKRPNFEVIVEELKVMLKSIE